MSQPTGLIKTSDLYASGISQGINMLMGQNFNATNFGVGIALRATGRYIFEGYDFGIPLLEDGNVAAGIMSGLYAGLVERQSLNQSLVKGAQTAVSNVLVTELLDRLNITDKYIL
jgi:hypothetical protein